MRIEIKRTDPIEGQVALVLGNFDGFHIGHMTLLEKAKEIAKQNNIASAVFSFEPHPSFVLRNIEPVDLINTRDEKEHVFESLGMDYYFEFPFTKTLAAFTPEAFIRDLLLKQVQPHTIIVGEDYHFGNKRAGNVDTLKELGVKYGFDVVVLQKRLYQGEEVSSTRIRKLLKEANITEANELLGRPFFINGIVSEGAKLGRTIGYPTANIVPSSDKLLPPFGVYVTHVIIDGYVFFGLTNVGNRPTVDTIGVNVESYILDFDEMIYGQEIRVEFLQYIRPEEKFDSLEILKEKIDDDVRYIKEFRRN